MLHDGKILEYVPNWWNPYAPNVGQVDPNRKKKVIILIKLIFVIITMVGGAILALCINLLANTAGVSPIPDGGGSRHLTEKSRSLPLSDNKPVHNKNLRDFFPFKSIYSSSKPPPKIHIATTTAKILIIKNIRNHEKKKF